MCDLHARQTAVGTVLALGLLTTASAPAFGVNVLDGANKLGLAADSVELLADTVACVTENPQAQQVAKTADAVATGASVVETTTVVTVIASGSGATIMKTLAAAGGPVTIGGATGLSAAKIMNQTLYADCQDPVACDAAHYGTYVGAALGTGASAATVFLTGAGPAGLATIGSVVGGGMAAGVGVLIAAPVVAGGSGGRCGLLAVSRLTSGHRRAASG